MFRWFHSHNDHSYTCVTLNEWYSFLNYVFTFIVFTEAASSPIKCPRACKGEANCCSESISLRIAVSCSILRWSVVHLLTVKNMIVLSSENLAIYFWLVIPKHNLHLLLSGIEPTGRDVSCTNRINSYVSNTNRMNRAAMELAAGRYLVILVFCMWTAK